MEGSEAVRREAGVFYERVAAFARDHHTVISGQRVSRSRLCVLVRERERESQ